ncbi:MAG: CHASE2 domain-containing protein [Cyanobacteria bacterium P01_C01_bin.72]
MAWSELRQKITKLGGVLAIAPSVAGLVIAGSLTGIYQTLEWSILDQWFRTRSSEAKETRVVVVEIGESDISELGEWPMSDGVMAELLSKIKQQQPRVIGLDLYRDLKQGEPAEQKRLEDFFRATPNIIGVEKAINDQVKPSPILKEIGQVAMPDFVLDADGKARRALMLIGYDDGDVGFSLGTLTALMYLEQEGILLEDGAEATEKMLGDTKLAALKSNSAGYINADAAGFQTLINYRGQEESFIHTSLTDILQNQIADDIFRDHIVLIGATAPSLNDFFYTPYSSLSQSSQRMPGVYVHANIASQIISTAIDGRTMLGGISESGEWLWILGWSFVGSGLSLVLLQMNLLQKDSFASIKLTVLGIVIPVGMLLTSSYLLFLAGYWLPTIAPLIAFVGANLVATGFYYQNQKRIAFTDGLTKIANRRFFDQFIKQQWSRCQRDDQDLAIILCDVDFFKIYNDTYGHQQGDNCLQKLASALSDSVRGNDLAARYGGEEFVVVLPDSNPETAKLVAQRIRSKLKAMQIPHEGSKASKYVSISMGIASVYYNKAISPKELIDIADEALYKAKEQGRDCAVVGKPIENETELES